MTLNKLKDIKNAEFPAEFKSVEKVFLNAQQKS
jgi:hypothetical protein